MKRLFHSTLFAVLFLFAACDRPQVISDDELAQIFHDAFLANAYIGVENVKTDSLRIYEPIFTRYGYTIEDVQYTIGNFSKRKSARLGDVVERAIVLLEEEGTYYNREVAVLDTIDNVARRAFTRRVFSDSLVRVKTLRDTSRLRLALPVTPGDYHVAVKYLVDSLDRNDRGLRGAVWLEKRDGSRTNYYSTVLRRQREDNFTYRLTADTSHVHLRVEIGSFYDKPKPISLKVTDFRVEYIPPTRQAIDSLFARQLDLRIFADEFLHAVSPKDSL